MIFEYTSGDFDRICVVLGKGVGGQIKIGGNAESYCVSQPHDHSPRRHRR